MMIFFKKLNCVYFACIQLKSRSSYVLRLIALLILVFFVATAAASNILQTLNNGAALLLFLFVLVSFLS